MSCRIARRSIARCLIAGEWLLFICATPTVARQGALSGSASSVRASNLAVKFQEQTVGKISGGSQLDDLQAAKGHVAWAEYNARSSKGIVFLDGKRAGGKYDGVKYLEFSAEGDHLAFFGEREGRWIAVLDGREYSSSSEMTPIVFQPQGTSWAFGSCVADNACHAIVNGEPIGRVYDEVSLPAYGPDGKRLAYLGQSKEKWITVLDGKEMALQVDGVSCLGFSPNSTHFVVCGQSKKYGWTYYIDGVPGPFFTQLSPIAFSKGDEHYVYGGSSTQYAFKKDTNISTIVLDGNTVAKYQGDSLPGEWRALLGTPILLASVYTGGSLIPLFLRVEEQLPPELHTLSPRRDGISDPIFDESGNPVYAARRGKSDVVVLDGGLPGPAFDDVVSGITFTKDGQHSAYVALRGKDFVEVLDNRLGEPVPLDSSAISPHKKTSTDHLSSPDSADKPAPFDSRGFSVGWATLTPDGDHFAYEIIKGGATFRAGMTPRAERIVVLDRQPGRRYNALGISTLRFSDEEKHYWYTVFGTNGKKGLVVVDGHESKRYDRLTEAQFDASSNSVWFFARAGSRILRVSTPLTDSTPR